MKLIIQRDSQLSQCPTEAIDQVEKHVVFIEDIPFEEEKEENSNAFLGTVLQCVLATCITDENSLNIDRNFSV